MFKSLRSKIGVQLLITFSVVLVLSMVSLIYIATELVAEFGEFSASRNEANIRDNAAAFLARISHEQAMRYGSTFTKFADSSALIAKQASFFLENKALYGKTPLKANEQLAIYPHNGIFSNDRTERTMVLYWGSPEMSQGIMEHIKMLSHLDPLLESVKEGNPASTSCYIVTEPGIARYYPNIHGVEKLPPTTKFDIRNANWYVIAKPENNPERKTVWSNIYLDSVGQGLLTTASTPVYSKTGEHLGAAGVDVTLDAIVNDILENIPSIHRMKDLFSFLVDDQGRIIAFPQEYLEMFEIKIDRDKLVDASVILKYSLLDSSNVEIRKMGQRMLAEKYQVSRFVLNGHPYMFSSHFMPSTGWRLGTVVPEPIILSSVYETRRELDSTVNSMAAKIILATVLFLICSIIIITIFSIKKLIRPLDKLSIGALRVKEGDLTTHVDVYTKNEIGSLTQVFNNMVDTLRKAKELEEEHTRTLEQKVRDRTREIMIKTDELKKTRERLELAMDAGDHGFWDWNLDTDEIYFSPGYYSMLGYDPGELPMERETWVKLMHPDDRKTIIPEVENFVKKAQPYEVEFRLKTKDGDWKWISGRGKSYEKDQNGVPHRALGVNVDISERKEAEEALRVSEKNLKAVLGASPVGIGLVVNRLLDWANETMYHMVGYEQGTLFGQSARVLYTDEEEFERVGRELYGNISELGISQTETRWVRKDGTVFDCILRMNSLDPSDPSKGQIIALTDISERKKLEAQLQRSRKMEAIGMLAGGVAHDLNNVLSGIVSYPELLLLDIPADSPLRKPILTIQRSGKKAADIVQDLLTLARRGVVATEVVNLNQIINSYLKSPEYKNLKKLFSDFKIERNLEMDLLNIMGSPVHLSKCFMNLVNNAAEAMPGGGNIFITTQSKYMDKPIRGYDDVKEGDYVVLTVSDTGIGISSEDMERIFDPFYTTKMMGRSGTGLGMAVVWGTVKDHKGYIDVQSTKGKGTQFTLYFPVTRKEMPEKEKVFPMEEYMGKGESILVVDDVEDQREIATRILEILGYSATSVSSGEDAVDYMRNNSADLLVLDMIMIPGIDGLETYKRILKLHPGQKAIIASGFSETESVKEAQRLGAGKYIKKPYTLEKIGLAVKEELEK